MAWHETGALIDTLLIDGSDGTARGRGWAFLSLSLRVGHGLVMLLLLFSRFRAGLPVVTVVLGPHDHPSWSSRLPWQIYD